MSTKAAQEIQAEKKSATVLVSEFLIKNRKVIIVSLSVILVAFLAFIAVTAISERRSDELIGKVETLQADWNELRGGEDKDATTAKEDEIISTLKDLADKNKGSVAGARAYMTVAEVYYQRKDWKSAKDAWLSAASAGSKSYVVGLCYVNAAVCADELGNQDEAVTLFTKASELDNFSMKPRALFNIGRIEEQRSQKEAALEAYEKLVGAYPDDTWSLLAKSRIIALQIQ